MKKIMPILLGLTLFSFIPCNLQSMSANAVGGGVVSMAQVNRAVQAAVSKEFGAGFTSALKGLGGSVRSSWIPSMGTMGKVGLCVAAGYVAYKYIPRFSACVNWINDKVRGGVKKWLDIEKIKEKLDTLQKCIHNTKEAIEKKIADLTGKLEGVDTKIEGVKTSLSNGLKEATTDRGSIHNNIAGLQEGLGNLQSQNQAFMKQQLEIATQSSAQVAGIQKEMGNIKDALEKREITKEEFDHRVGTLEDKLEKIIQLLTNLPAMLTQKMPPRHASHTASSRAKMQHA